MEDLCEDFLRFTHFIIIVITIKYNIKQTSYAFCGQCEFKVLLTEKPVKPRTSLVEPALPKGFQASCSVNSWMAMMMKSLVVMMMMAMLMIIILTKSLQIQHALPEVL